MPEIKPVRTGGLTETIDQIKPLISELEAAIAQLNSPNQIKAVASIRKATKCMEMLASDCRVILSRDFVDDVR